MSHSPGGPVAIGDIAADGVVTLALPVSRLMPPPMPQPLGQTFLSCRDDGVAIATPETAPLVPTSLFASRADLELGSLYLATDAQMVMEMWKWGQVHLKFNVKSVRRTVGHICYGKSSQNPASTPFTYRVHTAR